MGERLGEKDKRGQATEFARRNIVMGWGVTKKDVCAFTVRSDRGICVDRCNDVDDDKLQSVFVVVEIEDENGIGVVLAVLDID